MTTTTEAKAVKMDSSRDFAGELIDEKIQNATPVFWTYVMLKKPSITVTDSLTLNRLRMEALVQRSKISVAITRKAYGNRPWIFGGMSGGLYPVGSRGYHAVWYSHQAFSM